MKHMRFCTKLEDSFHSYEDCTKLEDSFHSNFSEFIVQDGLLFKSSQLCIPKCSMRENGIKEKHCGGLSGHFGLNKTLELYKDFIIGLRCKQTLGSLWKVVYYVKGQREYQQMLEFISLYPYQTDLGNV